MANTYKDIVITPNKGSSTDDPKIVFSGANTSVNTDITLRVYPDSNGSLSFEGSAGQLFSITNDLTGSLFSVNDVSGIPSIDVDALGNIDLAPYSGNVGIGTTNATSKLHVVGNTYITGSINTSSHLLSSTSNQNFQITTPVTGAAGILLKGGTTFAAQLYGDGTSYGFLGTAWGSWDFKKVIGGNTYFNADTTCYVNPAVNSRFNNVIVAGGIASDANTSYYYDAAVEVRELNFAGVQADIANCAPRIGMHWSGRVASQIVLESSGRIAIRNNPGNAYEAFIAGNMYGNILYDGNNTAYYCDPDSTSNFNGLITAGTTTIPKLYINRGGVVASGINWYSSAYTAWQEYMSAPGASQGWTGTVTAPSGTYVTSWALRSFVENVAGYGWTWESGSSTSTTPSVVADLSSNTGNFKTIGAINSGGNVVMNSNGSITFGVANPILSSSSYIQMPGGLYVSAGTLYATNQAQFRGGIHNDTAAYLTIAGGTSNITYVSGNMGIGNTAPVLKLEVEGNMAVDAFIEFDQAIATSYTITTGRNALSAGPITINSGVTITVPTGSVWSIV